MAVLGVEEGGRFVVIPGPQVRGTGGTRRFWVIWDGGLVVIPGPQVRGTGGTRHPACRV